MSDGAYSVQYVRTQTDLAEEEVVGRKDLRLWIRDGLGELDRRRVDLVKLVFRYSNQASLEDPERSTRCHFHKWLGTYPNFGLGVGC